MKSVGKWKIATYILAATTAASLYHGRGASESAAAMKPSSRDAGYHSRMSSLARLRIPASAVGVDEHQLLRDLAAATSIQKITLLCERLGIFGTDLALEPLKALTIRQPQALNAATMAMGGIGSDKATDMLIEMVGGGATSRSYWAVKGLAKSRNPRAEAQLLDWASGGNRQIQLTAVESLGQLESDGVIDILQDLSVGGDTELLYRIITAASDLATPPAVALVQDIANRGNRQLRMAALSALPSELSEAQKDWLMDVLATSDQQSAAIAAEALGRSGATDAMPLLLDAAQHGAPQLRAGAVRALAQLGGKEAMAVISELFVVATQNTAYEMGRALLEVGGEAGQKVFVEALQGGHPMAYQLIPLLADLSGPGVDALRLKLARNGSAREKQAVLAQLAGSDSDEVLELTMDLAQNGPQMTRYGAMDQLANSSAPRARELIVQIASGGSPASLEALRILGDRAGSDPAVEQLLIDALNSGNVQRAQTASWALANSGTQGASDALLAAVKSGDRRLAQNAMNSLGQLGATPDVTETLQELASNSTDPQIKSAAMYQLVASGAPEATAMVLGALRNGESGVDNLLPSLLMNAGPEGQEVIALASQSDNSATRAALANALAGQGADGAQTILDTLSRDEDFNVKSAAVYAMANVGSTESMDRLIDIAKNGDSQLRGVALSVIGNGGDPRASTIIAEAIGSADTQLAQSAMYAAYNAGPEVDDALLGLARNASADVYLRQQAVNALSNRGTNIGSDELARLQEAVGGSMPSSDGEYYDTHEWYEH